jgi:hypothetical protein
MFKGLKNKMKWFTVTLVVAVLASCNTINQAPQGGGAYYQPGNKAQKSASKNTSVISGDEEIASANTSESKELQQKQQPKVVNPESKTTYQNEHNQKGLSNKKEQNQDFDYYPEDGGASNDVYQPETNYRDYKYTNRIRRFNSDLSFSYFDPFYYGQGFGNNPYYQRPFRYRDGFSLGIVFGNTPYFTPYDRFGYRGYNDFYDPWDYRLGYRNGFYDGRYGFNDPYLGYGYSSYSGGFGGYPYHHYSSYNNEESTNEQPTMNRPRDPLGSNYDTDKTPDKNNRQQRGRNIQRRQIRQDSDADQPNRSDNKRYDYYQPQQKRKKPETPNRRTPNTREDRSNPSINRRERNEPNRRRQINPNRRPNRQQRQPDLNRQSDRSNRMDRSRFDRSRRQTPNTNNRNRGGRNKSDNDPNRRRR